MRVTDVRRQKAGDGAELLVSLQADARGRRRGAEESVPVQFEIDGARSEVTVELAGPRGRAEGPSHPAREGPRAGLGPGVDPGGRQPGGQRLLVRLRAAGAAAGDRRRRGRRGRPAARSWPRRSRRTRPLTCSAEVRRGRASSAAVDWDQVVAALVAGPAARRPRPASRSRRSSTAAARRSSFPPACRAPASCSASAGRRGQEPKAEAPVESWRGDEDLLAHTPSGAAAAGRAAPGPQVLRALGGEVTPLATLAGRRAAAGAGRRPTAAAAYFCATTPAPGDSSLATERRRLLRPGPAGAGRPGPRSLGNTRQLTAGEPTRGRPDRVGAGGRRRGGALDRIRRFTAASTPHGDRLLAVNRAAGEESAAGPGRPPRGRPVPAASTSPGSTTRPAASAR